MSYYSKKRVLLIVSVLLSAIVLVSTLSYLDNIDSRTAQYGVLTEIIVAKEAIKPGTAINENCIAKVRFPSNYVLEGMISDESLVFGKKAVNLIGCGEPILLNSLIDRNSNPISQIINDTKRGFVIDEDDRVYGSNSLYTGDVVDVIATIGGESETVLRGITVIVLNNANEPNSDLKEGSVNQNRNCRTVLALEEREAELLSTLLEEGTVRLIIRPFEDRSCTDKSRL